MPAGAGDLPDYERFSQQAGGLIYMFGGAWNADITLQNVYCGQYQAIGIRASSFFAPAADMEAVFTFSDDSFGGQVTGTRWVRFNDTTQVCAAVPVTGNYVTIQLISSNYGTRNGSFVIHGFSWPISGADFLLQDRFDVVSVSGVAAGAVTAVGLTRTTNAPVTMTVTTAAGPVVVELQQRTTAAASFVSNLVAVIPTGTTCLTVTGRMECQPAQILFRNPTVAGNVIIARLDYGPL